MTLADTLQTLMHVYDMRETELARQTGIKQPVINRLLGGSTTNPRIETLIPIARFFHLSIDQLIGHQPLNLPDLAHYVITATPLVMDYPSIVKWQATGVHDTHLYLNLPSAPPRTYLAIELTDTTMAPYYPKGCYVVIDQRSPVQDQDDVLFFNHAAQRLQFRRYMTDGQHAIFKCRQPEFPIHRQMQDDIIIGRWVLAQVRTVSTLASTDDSMLESI